MTCSLSETGHRENEGTDHDPTEDAGEIDRAKHSFGDIAVGVDGFFGGMGGGIETGDGVNGPHQAEEKHHRNACVPGPNIAAGFAAEICEGEEASEIMGFRGEKHRDGENNCDEEDEIATEVGQ